jgi:hypothetical protein
MRFAVGLDLGKMNDYSAVSVLEAHAGTEEMLPGYQLRHLVRYELGTRYGDIVEAVCQLMERKPLWGQARLAIDLTGVGIAVGEMFQDAGLRYIGIVITGGSGWRIESPREWHVSKSLLVSTVQKFLASGRLAIAQDVPHARLLKRELQDFRVRISKAANEIYEAREQGTDDMVLSLAIGLFLAEHPGYRFEGL